MSRRRGKHNKDCDWGKEDPCVLRQQKKAERQKTRMLIAKEDFSDIYPLPSSQGYHSW